MKAVKWLDEHFEEFMLVIFLVLISVLTMLQIIARNMSKALSWPEEFCRFCWIWSVFLSIPYTIRMNNMLRVNVVVDLLPGKLRKIINIIVEVIVTITMAVFFWHSLTVEQNFIKSQQTSPAMAWPMWLVLTCIVIGFGLGIIRGIQQIILQIKNFNVAEKTTLELTMEEAAAEAEAAKKGEGGYEA